MENNFPKQTAVKPTKIGEYWINIFLGVFEKIKNKIKLSEKEIIESNLTNLLAELLGQIHNRFIFPKEVFSVVKILPLYS